MGYGGYSSDAHHAILTTRTTQSTAEVFRETRTNAQMSPHGIKFRESRDSDAHPESLAIVFALDVTGSMRSIPEMIARQELPTFMEEILARGVQDPQLLFMAVGDMNGDRSPLQVGQFESEAQLMDRWLTMVHLEGGGCGNGGESYELAAYALARHSSIDCYEKRGHKGYVFFTGDDAAFPVLKAQQIRELFGDSIDEDIPTEQIFQELRQKYNVFFLIPHGHVNYTERGWRTLLGDNVVLLSGDGGQDTCLVSAAIVALNEGKVSSLMELADQLKAQGISHQRVTAIVRSLTPYAETLRKAGVPDPKVSEPQLPVAAEELTSSERRKNRRSAHA